MSYQIFSCIISFPLLIYAAITDIRFKEIPLKSSALAFIALLAGQCIYGFGIKNILFSFIAGAVLFGVMFINTLFFHGGGGDCILMGIIGFAFGIIYGLIALVLTCACMTGFYLLSNKKEIDYPMAPFILVGTLITYFI